MLRPVETQPSLRQIGEMLLRHKCKMAGTLLLAMIMSVAVTALMAPAYRSEAKLFVRLGRENAVLDATATMGQGPLLALPSSREDEINSVVEILRSQVLLAQIVETFGPGAILGNRNSPNAPVSERADAGPIESRAVDESSDAPVVAPVTTAAVGTWRDHLSEIWKRVGPGTDLSPSDKAIVKLQKRLSVYAAKKSNVITIRYDGPSPRMSQAVVSKLVDLYLAQHISLHRAPHSHDFFAKQTDGLRARLNQGENELRALRNETGVASVPERKKILGERIGKLEDDKLEADSELAVAEAELASLRDRLLELPAKSEVSRMEGLSNQAFDGMRQQLYGLQLKEQQLLSIFKEEASQVREIRREIAAAKKILDEEEAKNSTVVTGKNKAYEETELDALTRKTKVASLRARAEKIAEQLTAARSDMEQLNGHELRITQLERDVELQDAQFRAYARNMEQARIDQALETSRISNIGVVQPATLDAKAVHPKKLVNLGLGILIGGFAGLGLALSCEYFDHTLKTVDDVEERLGVPALGSIPRSTFRSSHNGTRGTHDHLVSR